MLMLPVSSITSRQTHANEPEFVQTVEEVLSSVSPIMDAHPEYEKVDLLKRMVEPERMFTFRVCWMDDNGELSYQHAAGAASSTAPSARTRAACASRRTSIEGIIKFLGFEQTFKNSLTGLPMGGGKGRLRLRSRRQVRRGGHALLPELHDRLCTATSGRTSTFPPVTWALAAARSATCSASTAA